MTNESHRDIDLRTQTEGVVVHDSEWVRLDEPVYPVAVKPYRGLWPLPCWGAGGTPGAGGLLSSGKNRFVGFLIHPIRVAMKKRRGADNGDGGMRSACFSISSNGETQQMDGPIRP